MSELTVRVEGLSKRYRLGDGAPYQTLRDSLERGARRLLGRRKGDAGSQEIWALDDVSFDLRAGEVLGVIGRNGAGKSTLLKILTRITRPTRGRAEVWGRVGSLLEVGTGFHPELTGRENIWLYGAILGLRRDEIRAKLDAIVAFSEVERFLETPVKHYSSGMQVRLAFAVAAHLEPEVLLVDEVLAVGDASFQRKCLGRMKDVTHAGHTVVFVSHNMAALQKVCTRIVWLEEGRVRLDGEVRPTISTYLAAFSQQAREREWPDPATAPGSSGVRLRRACVRPQDAGDTSVFTLRTPLVVEFDYLNLIPDAYLNLSVFLDDELGVTVFNTAPVDEPDWHGKPFPIGLFRSRFLIPGDLLNDGVYRLTLLVVRDQSEHLLRMDDVLSFELQDDPARRGDWHGDWVGVIRPDLPWTTELLAGGLPPELAAERRGQVGAAGARAGHGS